MDNFKFRSGKKTLNIEDKEYVLDVGNQAQLKAWLSKIGELDKLAKSMDVESDTVIDDLVRLEKEIVEATIGDWDRLWGIADSNVFAMLDLVRMLSDVLKESVSDRMKAYGL